MHVAVIGCGYWGKNLVRNFAQLGALSPVSYTHLDVYKRQLLLSQ